MTIRTPEQFAAARRMLGLSVTQCARVCNVDDRTVRRWERGAGRPGGRDPHPSACRILELAVTGTISPRRVLDDIMRSEMGRTAE